MSNAAHEDPKPRRKWRRHARPLAGATIIVAAASLAFLDIDPPRQLPSTEPVDLRFIDPSGGEQSLATMRGQPVLVHIWATYCPPCRVELPSLLDYEAEGEVQTVLISVDSTWKALTGFFPEGVPSSVVIARPSDVGRSLGVSSLPETFLLDDKGRIVEHFRGPHEWNEPQTRERIRLALTQR